MIIVKSDIKTHIRQLYAFHIEHKNNIKTMDKRLKGNQLKLNREVCQKLRLLALNHKGLTDKLIRQIFRLFKENGGEGSRLYLKLTDFAPKTAFYLVFECEYYYKHTDNRIQITTIQHLKPNPKKGLWIENLSGLFTLKENGKIEVKTRITDFI